MVASVDKDLLAMLEKARTSITDQRKQQEREHKQSLEQLDKRERLIQQTIDGLRSSNGNGRNGNGNRAPKKKATPSIGQERFDKVIGYLEKHGKAKQTALVKELELNSGTVSTALKLLKQSGKVQLLEEKEDGSQVWEMLDDGRETVVEIGKGARKGRRRTKQAA